MKVVMLAAGYPPDVRGNSEFSSQILAESLAKAGVEMHVLACSAKGDDYVSNFVHVRKVESPNIYWSFSPKPRKWREFIWHVAENYNPLALATITGFLKETKADLLLTSSIENFGAEAWRAPGKLGIKCVHILRDYYAMCRRGTAFRKECNCFPICLSCRLVTEGRRRTSQMVNGVIGLSRTTLDRHIEEGLFKNAARTVLPDPVYSAVRDTQPRRLARTPVFGYLGSLAPNKGLETLAAAMRGADTKLLIAGTGDQGYINWLKSEFGDADVTFVGGQDDEHFLSGIDYLIAPSPLMDPFARVVVKAFAAGVPVVGSAIGSIGEIVTPGANGLLFVPEDEDALAAAMRAAKEISPAHYNELSAQAVRDAQKYTGPSVAHQDLQFFDAILNGRAKPGEEWQPT